MEIRFTAEEAAQASDAWGFNCGPGAICGEARGYTNPTLMLNVLKALSVKFSVRRGRVWPRFGLARIQWAGPWTQPGVPALVAYRHTHWVGVRSLGQAIHIFDINAVRDGGWLPVQVWSQKLVPWLLEQCEPRATGQWWQTHAIEIGRSAA